MSIWKEFCREWRRYFKATPSFERLARLKAYRMNGKELDVVKIYPAEDGFFVRLFDPNPFDHHTTLWINHPIEVRDGRIRVQYHPEPQRELITMYGWFNYLSEPTTYLTIAE